MDTRKQFLSQIKEVFAPVLKADGFTLGGNTYRRVLGEVIHVIKLQGSIQGGRCCVCLGIHLSFLPSAGSATLPDPARIEEVDCEFRTRLGLPGQSDASWNYGTTEEEAKSSAKSICQLYQQVGKPYFQRFARFPDDFTRVTPAMLAAGGELPFPPGNTFVRRVLALSHIALRLGRAEEARQFAEIGLENVGQATGPKLNFKRIIAAALPST